VSLADLAARPGRTMGEALCDVLLEERSQVGHVDHERVTGVLAGQAVP
jgi:hypothetical protein